MRLFLSAALAAASSAAAAQPVPALVDTPVLIRTVEKGALLSAADFTTEPRPARAAQTAVSATEVSGMEAARRLMTGAPVRAADLVRAQQVRRGEPVTIALRSGGLLITTAGRALSGGAVGDPVRVVSLGTNRTLDGVIEESGRVRVTAQ